MDWFYKEGSGETGGSVEMEHHAWASAQLVGRHFFGSYSIVVRGAFGMPDSGRSLGATG